MILYTLRIGVVIVKYCKSIALLADSLYLAAVEKGSKKSIEQVQF